MKKMIALVTAAVIVAGMAACANQASAPQTAAPAATTAAAPKSTTAAAPKTTTAAAPKTTTAAPAATTAAATTAAPASNAARDLAKQYGLPETPLSDMPPMTFTVFNRGSDEPSKAGNKIIDIIEKVTNTKIELHYLVGDEATKIGVMIASGDMEDGVFVGGTTGPFIDAGCFVPLEDLITKNAPHLADHYKPWWNAMKHTDGHIYIAELFGTPSGPSPVMENWGSAMWMQKDVLDHFGRAPKTLNEYFDFIKQYMDLNPTIDGMPTRGFEILAQGYKWIDNPPLFLSGQPNWGGVYVPDEKAAIAKERWTPDFVKTWFLKLNEEYRRGTVPKDTLTLTQDQYLANIATGSVLAFHDQMWAFNPSQDALRADGKDNRTYLPLAITYDGVEPNYMDLPAFTGNNGLGISTSCKDPVRFLQYMDWIVQEPVQKLLCWGIEGQDYTYEKGRMIRTDATRTAMMDARWSKDNLGKLIYDNMPKMQGVYSDGNAVEPGGQAEEYFAALRPYDKTLFQKLGIQTQAGFMGEQKKRPSYYPVWSMTIPDGSPAKLADTRAGDIRTVYYPQLITCDPANFDTIWAEYVKEINNCGIQDYIDEVNRQIQERIKVRGGID